MKSLEDILPRKVAIQHTAYERAARVHMAHKAGASCAQIGRVLGIGRGRARQLNYKAEHARPISPIEMYFKWPLYTDWEKKKLRQYVGEFLQRIENPKRKPIAVRWEE